MNATSRCCRLVVIVLSLFAGVAVAEDPATDEAFAGAVEDVEAAAEVAPGTVDDAPAAAEALPLPDEIAQQFRARLGEIEEQQQLVAKLNERRQIAEGTIARVLATRMDQVWASMFENTLNLARDVAEQRDNGFDVSHFITRLKSDLKAFPDQAIDTMSRLAEGIVFPTGDMDPSEMVILDKKLLQAINQYDDVLESLVTYTQIADTMQIDASDVKVYLIDRLKDGAANRSAYLQLSINEVTISRGAAATLPKDEKLPARVAVAEARVKTASAALQEATRLMDFVGLDSRQYRQQILTATGQLTTDVLDVGVVGGLVSEWSKSLYTLVRSEGPKLALQFLLFVLIIWVAARLRGLTKQLATKALLSYDVNMSHLLKRMIVSTIGNLIFVFGLLIALSQVGVSLGPLLAGLGIAGFIIGFALQDTLSNFASGMMILLYRPFDVGDVVEAAGVSGKVDRMSLVNTTFKTFDNQVVVVPNNLIWKTVITNLTDQTTRRVDLVFSVSYKDDIDKAKAILKEAADGYDKVLRDPEPMVKVGTLGESSVDLLLRPWVNTSDYWETYWDLTEIVKKRFDEEGITIPFPQRTVHTVAD